MSSITITEDTGLFHLPVRFPLERGGALRGAQLAYELVGPQDGPLVIVQGGISAGRVVHGGTEGSNVEQPRGWWGDIVGDGLAIDTSTYRVLGIDYLGGSGGSTGPDNFGGTGPFPSVTPRDQARATSLLLDQLQVPQATGFVGASYGGMVGLALAAEFPDRVRRLVAISAAHRSHPMATAWRSIQRRIVELGLEGGAPQPAVELARGLAMATYRSRAEFLDRFDGEPELEDGRIVFPVERYLGARGRAFAERFSARVFLCLSQALDLHRIDPSDVRAPTTLVAVDSDQLVPLEQMQELSRRIPAPCELSVIRSVYGHDAFLKEVETLTPIIANALVREVESLS